MKHYSTDLTDSQYMLLSDILMDNRKRKHSLCDISMQSFICLKQDANGVRCQAVFPFGNRFITISPNGRTTVSLNKYMNCFAIQYAKKQIDMNHPVWLALTASLLKQSDWVANIADLMVAK